MLTALGESLSDVGEFAFISRLRTLFSQGPGVSIGPGDDAAALAFTPGRRVLATTDMLAEGLHFDLAFSAPQDVGWKAIASNVSDIAAMGGVPRFALVAIGAPGHTGALFLERLARGMHEASGEWGVSIAGGDMVGGETITISVALLGEEGEAGVVTRSGARSGDVVCVTGEVGAAAAGLALLRSPDPEAAGLAGRLPALVSAHRRGNARVREGQSLARAGATAMIDCSDGLGADAAHIAEESGSGIELDARAIPIAPGVAEVALWLGEEPWSLALRGGDDYELIVTLPPQRVDEARAEVAPTPLTVVGRVGVSGSYALDPSGKPQPIGGRGWTHFS